MATIGIPYAPGEATEVGLVRICPVCEERVLEPWAEFDAVGEYVGKDSDVPMPSPYQLHFMVYHGDHDG